MPICELIDSCAFYNRELRISSERQEAYIKRFCKFDQSQCARFKVYKTLGKEKIPSGMLPNQFEMASGLIRANQKKKGYI